MRPMILLIDDEKAYAEVIRDALRSRGVDVEIACNATEALFIFQQSKPDLILLDVMMPEIDGLTLLKWLREHSEDEDIPIHIVSAKTMPEAREAAISAGANGFLAKPFTMGELQDVLAQYLPIQSSSN